MNIIVNLLSDQTIPNLLFLKHFCSQTDHILSISSQKMEIKREWLENAFAISQPLEPQQIHKVLVDEFDFTHIKDALQQFNFDNYDKIIVNVTGGTKVMSLAAFEFFKDKAADIYYITGKQNEMLKLFPNRLNKKVVLDVEINLKEYLTAYGYAISFGKSRLSKQSEEYTQSFKDWFINHKTESEYKVIQVLQSLRDKNIINIAEVASLSVLLASARFKVENSYQLTKRDIQYLTGGWFEEYIYYRIKNELQIPDECIDSGIVLKRGDVSNEFDVIFIYHNTLYTIECKTYIINEQVKSLVNDTLYKSTALAKQQGLYTKTFVFTLDRREKIKSANLNRAKELGISIIALEDLQSDKTMAALLTI